MRGMAIILVFLGLLVATSQASCGFKTADSSSQDAVHEAYCTVESIQGNAFTFRSDEGELLRAKTNYANEFKEGDQVYVTYSNRTQLSNVESSIDLHEIKLKLREDICRIDSIQEDSFILENEDGEIFRIDGSHLGRLWEGDQVKLSYRYRVPLGNDEYAVDAMVIDLLTAELDYCTVDSIQEDSFTLSNEKGELYRIDSSFLEDNLVLGDFVVLEYRDRVLQDDGTYTADVYKLEEALPIDDSPTPLLTKDCMSYNQSP